MSFSRAFIPLLSALNTTVLGHKSLWFNVPLPSCYNVYCHEIVISWFDQEYHDYFRAGSNGMRAQLKQILQCYMKLEFISFIISGVTERNLHSHAKLYNIILLWRAWASCALISSTSQPVS